MNAKTPQTPPVSGDDYPLRALSAIADHLSDELCKRQAALDTLQSSALRLEQIIETEALLAEAGFDSDAFLRLVTERMLLITPASGAVVELVEGDDMVYRAASGAAAPYVGVRLHRDTSISGLCVREREVLITHDTHDDPRVDAEACRRVGAMSLVVAPLFHRGDVVGVLKIMANQRQAFCDGDVQTLRLMAGLLGSAISKQQNYDTIQQLLTERTEALEALRQESERRRHTEAMLQKNAERTRRIIESANDAFVSLDHRGHVIDWNRQTETLFHWPREALASRPLHDVLLPPDQREKFASTLTHLRQAQHDGVASTRFELEALNRHGLRIPIEVSMSTLDIDGECCFSAFLQDISERKQHEARLRTEAERDALTGLANRRVFDSALEQLARRCADNQALTALLYMDVDYFKSVNDTLGHLVGDALLVAFAERLRSHVRQDDLVARLGGDEFVVLLDRLPDPATAERIAGKLVAAMAEPFELSQGPLTTSTSIGLAFNRGMLDAKTWLAHADCALYQAKAAGRGCYRIAA